MLFAGRLDPQKRPDWLLERMPEIFRRLTDHDLIIAGEGPMREALRRQAARLGIGPRIHFVGWQPDMPRLLAATDIVLLSSRWEGMPNIVLEAMAAARPVVTTEVHGVRELLGECDQGQITTAFDAGAFVESVVHIAGDPDLATRLGRLNQQRASNRFSIDRMIAAYVSVYDSLLERSQRVSSHC
jgi:starch synthase (maltosyl-transferring)